MTYPLKLLRVILLPRSFQDGFFFFPQVREFLHAGLVQSVDDGIFALRDEDTFDLIRKE